MTEADALASLRSRLPRHAALIDSMCDVVTRDDRWRFLEVGCSLGAGGGDELSDIDAGVGYDGIRASDLYDAARGFAVQIGVPVDLVVHRMDGWSDDVCRVAAEYADRLQLDLVLMPADGRRGLPDRSISVVDKDQRLAVAITPPGRLPPSIEVAREWVVLGWWAIATADKYVRRSSLFEAIHAIDEARTHALRLWAAGRGVPYAAFGLTSLLDFPPFELPHDLIATYAVPGDVDVVATANRATADLLAAASASAGAALGADVSSPLAAVVRGRLAGATAMRPLRPPLGHARVLDRWRLAVRSGPPLGEQGVLGLVIAACERSPMKTATKAVSMLRSSSFRHDHIARRSKPGAVWRGHIQPDGTPRQWRWP